MHVNPCQPNILQDMQAAAKGRDLRNRNSQGLLTAKRYTTPRKVYPYNSTKRGYKVETKA